MKLILVLSAAGFLAIARGRRNGCAPGEGLNSQGECYPCGPGTYSDGYICVSCPAGYTSSDTRATHASSCTSCAKVSMRNRGICVLCPVGSSSDTINAASCTSCPDGQTTFEEGAVECYSCEPGAGYSRRYRSCLPCTHGSFSGNSGYYSEDHKCKPCPEGYRTPGMASSIQDCTVCHYGYGGEGDHCVRCPIGRYADFEEQVCKPCPSGSTTSRTGHTYCRYMPGHLRTGYSDRQPVCEACPIGTFYVGGWFGCERCKKGMTMATVASTSKYDCFVP